MDSAPVLDTNWTLLGQLRQDPTNEAAWAAFVARYGRKIYGWCRQWGLPGADAEDVTQDVLLRLAQHMATFSYDPTRSFRAWLKVLTQHAWSDFLAWRGRAGRGGGDPDVAAQLDSVAARDDLVARLNAEFDQEVLEAATARVRLRVQLHTWDAYRLTALEGLSGAEAAAQLGLKPSVVLNAKYKVHKMLQEEVAKLEKSP